MRKLFTISILSVCAFAFGQTTKENLIKTYKKDLSKNEAYKLFKSSNVGKTVGYKFNYNDILESAARMETKNIRDIVLFNKINDKHLLDTIKYLYFQGTNVPKGQETPKCDDCSLVLFNNEDGVKEYNFRGFSYESSKN